MSHREILKTENVLVRIMDLDKGSYTEWHFHTEVIDFFVCLKGAIQIETKKPNKKVLLIPGQQAEVAPKTVHRVINANDAETQYLLIQGVGTYDFLREEIHKDNMPLSRP